MADTPPVRDASTTTHGSGATMAGDASSTLPDISDQKVALPVATAQESAPPSEPTPLVPWPHQGVALFSTDLGRRPKRNPPGPPYPPVIVVSDFHRGVADFAHRLAKDYPHHYKCYFPFCGHTIDDLFDKADIHLHSPYFLQEVLTFITRENVMGLHRYTREWSMRYPDRTPLVVNYPYDQADPLGIVYEVFTNGETEQVPAYFLWHVANNIRRSFLPSEMLQDTPSVADVQVNGTADEPSKTDREIERATVAEPKVDAGENRQTLKPLRGGGPDTHVQPPNPHPLQSTMPMQPRSKPFVPPVQMHTPRLGPQNAGPVIPFAIAGNTPHAQMNLPPLRNPKGRAQRQSSSSFNQPPPHHGWAENMPMHLPGPPSRQTSGPVSAVQSPQFQTQIPMGQPMANHLNPMGTMMQFPQNGMMLPNTMHAGPPYPSMVQGPPQHQAGPFSNVPMDPSQQGYSGFTVGPRGPPIGDMTNGTQFHFNPNAQRNDQHGNTYRRTSRPDRPPGVGLYNPYGPERPDFANIPPQTGNRKGQRNSFSNPLGRGRRQSSSSYNRANVGLNNFEQGAPSAVPLRGGHMELPNLPSNYFPRPDIIPSDPLDVIHGCSDDFIGPKNDSVNELIIFDVPPAASDRDIISFFFQHANGAKALHVKFRHDRNERRVATVRFASVADARKGLAQNRNAHFLGKPLSIKVPSKFYSSLNADSGSFTQGDAGSRRMSGPQHLPNTNRGAHEARKPTYSPQDARSDLLPGMGSEQPTTVGSPEARKPKKQNKSPKKNGKAMSETSRGTGDASIASSASTETPKTSKEKAASAGKQKSSTDIVRVAHDPPAEKETVSAPAKEIQSRKESPIKVSQQEQSVVGSITPPNKLIETAANVTMPAPDHDVAVSAGISEEPNDVEGTVKVLETSGFTKQDDPASGFSETAPPTQDIDRPDTDATKDVSPVQGALKEEAVGEQNDESVREASPRTEGDDEEQKNDSSFHSAKEVLSDAGKDEANEESPQGQDVQTAEVSLSKPETVTSESEKQQDLTGMEAKSENSSVQLANGPATASASVSAPAEKKQGAKQTEALFPYAKSKAQIKKEKDQKKKEKKKAKTQKNVPAPSTKPNDKSDAKPKGATSQDIAPTSSLPESSSMPDASDSRLEQEAVSGVTAENVKGEKDDSTGGKEFDLPMAPMGESPQEFRSRSPVQTPKQEDQKPQVAVDGAQSAESGPDGAAGDGTGGETTLAAAPESAPAGTKKRRPASLMVAVPNIKLSAKKTSPTPSGSDTTNANTVVARSPKGGASDTTKDGDDRTDRTTNDRDSVTDSATVRGTSPGLLSPSPTAADFHTPAQTPSALAPPVVEQPKKSKSRKKKKKQPAAPAQASAAESSGLGSEPFREQLNHIDSLKSSHAAPPPEEAGNKEQSNSVVTTLYEYVKEKQHAYSAIPRDVFENARPKPGRPVSLSSTSLDQLLERDSAAVAHDEMKVDAEQGERLQH